MGEKRNVKKGKKHVKNMELSTCICFAFILLSRFAFLLLLFCYFCCKTRKKHKANRESKINAKQMQVDKSMFSHVFPFWRSFFFPFFSPSVLFLCFLDFADFLFVFSIFFAFVLFFFKCVDS